MFSSWTRLPAKYPLITITLVGSSVGSVTAWAESFDTFDCEMMRAEIQRPLGGHISELHCKVTADGRPDLAEKIFKLENLPREFPAQYQNALEKALEKVRQQQAQERLGGLLGGAIGPLRLNATKVVIGPDDTLQFTEETTWSFQEPTSNGSNQSDGEGSTDAASTTQANSNGAKSVLVVRVIAPDAQTSLSTVALSDEVFGTMGDPVNLVSQFKACSYDQLNFAPATGEHIIDGVVEVTIDQVVNGTSNGVVRNAVSNALTEKLGYSATSRFDHVMYALPPGTSSGWIAYAYINSSLSVYNDRWASYVSAQMHEIGHNLGLSHSGEGGSTYADQSGMMGFSYSRDDGPVMCFNAAKSAFLKWYDDKKTSLNTGQSQTITLTGIAEYGAVPADEQVILNINGGQSLYLTFNAAKGINSGTVEGKNQVMVVQQSGVETGSYSSSNLLAKLNAGESFSVAGFGDDGTDLTVTVDAIGLDTGTGYDFATVTVDYGEPPVNQPPVAESLQVSGTENTDLDILLPADDPDGDTLTYSFMTLPTNGTLQGDGPAVTYTPQENFTGQDSFSYVVSDGQLTSEIATVTITVNPAEQINEPPVATFTVTPTAPNTGEFVLFDASGAMDSDGEIVSYAWDFGDGNTDSGVMASHAYTQPGTYTATLTVVDDGQLSATSTQVIEVLEVVDPNAPPIAPSDLVASKQGRSGIVLTWRDNANNEVFFEIERAELLGRGKSETEGPWVKIDEVGANVTTFTDQPERGRYRYRVRAVNDNGASAYSNNSDYINF